MTSAPATNPDLFGPYEIYERLGVGGMATVHRAKKLGPAGFERSVALKRILPHLAEDPSFVESFVREAKVASLLVHPNIAQVYDFGRIGGIYYIAMELIAGFDVRKILRYANRANEAIPLPVVLSIIGELCDALEYAHTFVDEHGAPLHIVHRDISPSNAIIAHTGHLKVIDFGIAKANSRQLHTESGLVKGKLGYMSPEAALGIPIGPVSDIFSVGVVAWELVTASPLFSSRTDLETMRRIREGEIVPPSRRNPSCPPELDQIILAALEREPERRIASAGLLRDAIDDLVAARGISVSARSVADWMLRFAQPEDGWARASASGRTRTPSGGPSGFPPPLPPEQVTARHRPASGTRPPQLRRSSADIQLATEIWGDDARPMTAVPGPDFSAHVSPPGHRPSLPIAAPPETHMAPPELALSPPDLFGRASAMGGPHAVTFGAPAAPPVRSRRNLLAIAGVLTVVAAVLAGVLVSRRSADPPAMATVRFEIEPAGATVEIGGKEVAMASPFETELAPGVYSVAVRRDGFVPWTSSITVRSGDHPVIDIALDRAEVAAASAPPVVAATVPAQPTVPEPAVAPDETVEPDTTRRKPTRPKTPPVTAAVAPPEPTPPPDAAIPPPRVDPDPPPPVRVDPPPPPPPPPPDRPTRTAVVAASAVTKVVGELPPLRVKGDAASAVLAKMCIDEIGKVSSVKLVRSPTEIAGELKAALAQWRYKPYLNSDRKPSPVCFVLSLRLVVK